MKRIISLLITVVTIINLSACGSVQSATPTNAETCRIYQCDYKSLNMNTKITTTFDGKEISIVGDIFKIVTDPLTVKDSEGNLLGYAGDAYGVISQDDHGIYIGKEFDINMCGNVMLIGNSYNLKDAEGNTVATASFNMTNTGGSIVDIDGNLIAEYSSSIIANDYTVTIYDNDICSDLSILMIMASYVSDYKADS